MGVSQVRRAELCEPPDAFSTLSSTLYEQRAAVDGICTYLRRLGGQRSEGSEKIITSGQVRCGHIWYQRL